MARVLVLEDRPAIGMLFNLALSEAGHDVEVRQDGTKGWERLQAQPQPELLIIDLQMPGLSGKEVVEKKANAPQLKGIPVIITSGSLPRPEIMPPKGTYQKFISKPFDLNEVIDTVAQLTASSAIQKYA